MSIFAVLFIYVIILANNASLSSLTLQSLLPNQRTHLPLNSSSLVKVTVTSHASSFLLLLHFNAHTLTAKNFLKLGWTNDFGKGDSNS